MRFNTFSVAPKKLFDQTVELVRSGLGLAPPQIKFGQLCIKFKVNIDIDKQLNELADIVKSKIYFNKKSLENKDKTAVFYSVVKSYSVTTFF